MTKTKKAKTNPLRDAMEGNPWSEKEEVDWEFEQAEQEEYETLGDMPEEDTND